MSLIFEQIVDSVVIVFLPIIEDLEVICRSSWYLMEDYTTRNQTRSAASLLYKKTYLHSQVLNIM